MTYTDLKEVTLWDLPEELVTLLVPMLTLLVPRAKAEILTAHLEEVMPLHHPTSTPLDPLAEAETHMAEKPIPSDLLEEERPIPSNPLEEERPMLTQVLELVIPTALKVTHTVAEVTLVVVRTSPATMPTDSASMFTEKNDIINALM